MQKQALKQLKISGFTLVEVLLVILLIGLLASTVVMSFSSDTREEKLEKEAERFVAIFQYVAETALLKQQEWGLYVHQNSYGFVYFDYKKNLWLDATEPKGVKAHTLPQNISLNLVLDGLPGLEDNLLSQLDWQETDDEKTAEDEKKRPALPQVFVLSSGEISPFQLVFKESSDLKPLYVSVSTDFTIPLSRTPASENAP